MSSRVAACAASSTFETRSINLDAKVAVTMPSSAIPDTIKEPREYLRRRLSAVRDDADRIDHPGVGE